MSPLPLGLFIAGVFGLTLHVFGGDLRSIRSRPVAHRAGTRKAVPVARPKKVKKSIPLAGVCLQCDKTVTMPFRCKFCDNLYCSGHRLPEDHACDGL